MAIPIFAFFGVKDGGDLVLPLLDYALDTVGKMIPSLPYIGNPIQVDMTNNFVSMMINNPEKLTTCASDPLSCGLSCKRIPDLTWKVGSTSYSCTTFCAVGALTEFDNMCLG